VIADPAAVVATLDPDALVLGNGSFALGRTREAAAVVAELARAPSGRAPLSAQIESIEAASNHDALWFSAHVTITHSGWRGRTAPEVTTARIVELAVQVGNRWGVVALAFVAPLGGQPPTLTLDRPKNGALTGMLNEPDELEHELVDSGELAVGTVDARRELAPWRHRRVELVGALEVHGPGWAWAAGELEPLDDRRAGHLRTFVLATRADGEVERWHVVAVHAIAVAPSDGGP
jgi:hypothetical protein